MLKFYTSIAAVFALLAISGPPPGWIGTDATDVQARQVKGGVEISASVDLRNPCWEASIIVDPSGAVPAEYDVVTRTQPKKIGVMCIQQIVPTRVHAWFPIVQQSVTVHTSKRTLTVKVTP